MVTRSYPDHEGEKKTSARCQELIQMSLSLKTFDVPASFVHAGSERPDVLRKRFKSD